MYKKNSIPQWRGIFQEIKAGSKIYKCNPPHQKDKEEKSYNHTNRRKSIWQNLIPIHDLKILKTQKTRNRIWE